MHHVFNIELNPVSYTKKRLTKFYEILEPETINHDSGVFALHQYLALD